MDQDGISLMDNSISSYHRWCFAGFLRVLSPLKSPSHLFRKDISFTDISNEFDRYKLWCSNVGAAHDGPSYRLSLDYRLREAPLYKKQIGDILNRLAETLERTASLLEGKSQPFESLRLLDDSGESSSDVDSSSSGEEENILSEPEPGLQGEDDDFRRRLASIRDAVANTDLEAIRSATKPLIDPQSLNASQKPISEVPQLLETLRFTITCLYRIPIRRPATLDRSRKLAAIDLGYFEPFDNDYVDERCLAGSAALKEKLKRMISHRRRLLKYRAQHYENIKLDVPRVASEETRELEPAIPITDSEQLERARPTASENQSNKPSQFSKATTFNPADFHEFSAKLLSPDNVSVTESLPSTSPSLWTENQKLYVPPRPKCLAGGKEFLCPYCFVVCQVKSDEAWKHHVLKDLEPYICTFSNCDMGDHQFDDRNDWYEHELQNHRIEWCCNLDGHSPCTSQSEFLLHLQKQHPSLRSPSLMHDIIRQFQRPAQKSLKICPFCSKPSENLKRHVSCHMEQMALYVLGGNNQEELKSGSDASDRAMRINSTTDLGSNEDSVDWEHHHPSEISDSLSPKDDVLDEQSTVPDTSEVPWTIPFDILGSLNLTATIIVFLNFASRLVSEQVIYPDGMPLWSTLPQTLLNNPERPQSILTQLHEDMKKENTLGCLTQIERALGIVCDQALDLCRDLAEICDRVVIPSPDTDVPVLQADFISGLTPRLQAELITKIDDLRHRLQVDVLQPFYEEILVPDRIQPERVQDHENTLAWRLFAELKLHGTESLLGILPQKLSPDSENSTLDNERAKLRRLKWRHREADLKAKVTKAKMAGDDNEIQSLREQLVEAEKEIRFADLRSEISEGNSRGDTLLAAKLQGELDKLLAMHNTHQPLEAVEEAKMDGAADTIAVDQSHQLRALQDAIVNSLRFPAINDRQESIALAHANTFEWIFQPQSPPLYITPFNNFGEWLRSGDGIFWVNGKAGSGKSTLMKFICTHPKTVEMLRQWSRQERVTIASFFFWNIGTAYQKSMTGLLSAILYDLLRQNPDKVKSTFPQHWKDIDWKSQERQADSDLQRVNPNSPHGSDSSEHTLRIRWTLHELQRGLIRLLSQLDYVCLFIDGLDEFDGDPGDMTELITSVASHKVKICLSSRPWVIFQDAFDNVPSLRMQDLTYNDIRLYVEQTFRESREMQLFLRLEPSKGSKLVEEVIRKADGVFLWVILVVRSLCDGLRNGDSISDLQRRLEQLPPDLEELFRHILLSNDRLHFLWASQTFQITQRATHFEGGLCAVGLSFLELPGHDETSLVANTRFSRVPLEDISFTTERIRRLLKSRCGGLLELVAIRDDNASIPLAKEGNCKVQYLHRTVADFFALPEISKNLIVDHAGEEFPANRSLLACYIMRLRRCFHTPVVHAEFALWASLVTQIMELVQIIEQETRSSEIELLDELDRTITRQSGTPPHNDCESFLAFATVHGLTIYLGQKLFDSVYAKSSASKDHPTSYLYLALCCPWRRRSPDYRMVNLLLRQGADPNQVLGKTTVWQKYLGLIAGQESNADSDHLRIIKQLLSHGADPMATRIDVSVRGVVEPVSDVVRYAFPEAEEKRMLQIFIEETIGDFRKRTRDVSDTRPSSSSLLSSGVNWTKNVFRRRKE